MDIVYNIVIPIITSLIGGLIGGLFTFLGVKMTLSHERKQHDEDKKLREEEQHKKETAKTIERNKRIILTRPKMTISKSDSSIKKVEEVCLLPYIKPKLFDEKIILFNYPNDIFKEEYWDKYEFVLQNTGKREIVSAFLQVPYKSGFNLYNKIELMSWQNSYFSNYYSDVCSLPSYIHPNEKIKIIVYFPKTVQKFREAELDLYFYDEDNNYWYQRLVNIKGKNEVEIIAPDAYYMHYQEDCNVWFIYDHLYYAKDVEKCFNKDIRALLEERKRKNWARTEKQDEYVSNIKCGEIALKYNLPLE